MESSCTFIITKPGGFQAGMNWRWRLDFWFSLLYLIFFTFFERNKQSEKGIQMVLVRCKLVRLRTTHCPLGCGLSWCEWKPKPGKGLALLMRNSLTLSSERPRTLPDSAYVCERLPTAPHQGRKRRFSAVGEFLFFLYFIVTSPMGLFRNNNCS